jgi:hypothetical protein
MNYLLYSNKIDFSIATGLQTRCYGKIALFFKKPLNFEYSYKKTTFALAKVVFYQVSLKS